MIHCLKGTKIIFRVIPAAIPEFGLTVIFVVPLQNQIEAKIEIEKFSELILTMPEV